MYSLLRSLLFRLDAERAHEVGTALGRLAVGMPGVSSLLRSAFSVSDDRLTQRCFGISFPGPVGLAAGFDKNGRNVGLASMLGFHFMEAGSVTPEPWSGNQKPRLFRLPADRALINRMGFNNDGAAVVAERLRGVHPFPVGVSVSKTPRPELTGDLAVADYAKAVAIVRDVADFIVVDVSCPNTADGMSFARDPQALETLLTAVQIESKGLPLLAKLTVDLDDAALDEAIRVVRRLRLSGVVLSNTTTSRADLHTDASHVEQIGRGGLSGPPLFERARRAVARAYSVVGSELTIIGCGGIDSAAKAYQMLAAGASLVELYTGLVYEGPSLPLRISKGLLKLLEREGLNSISELIGRDAACHQDAA